MVRASVDELLYNEKRNEVVFVKYLEDGAGRPGAAGGNCALSWRRQGRAVTCERPNP